VSLESKVREFGFQLRGEGIPSLRVYQHEPETRFPWRRRGNVRAEIRPLHLKYSVRVRRYTCDPKLCHDAIRDAKEPMRPIRIVIDGQLQRVKKQSPIRGLNRNCNHDLKNLFKGAAIVASSKPGPFQEFYTALLTKGIRPEMARLTLARKRSRITPPRALSKRAPAEN
jgi:hypothetical protein